MGYPSVTGDASAELILERSRFLSYACHVESEEEARARIAALRGQHPLATHVCFAFIADKAGNLQRFFDDGEPQGTAGMPILGVLKAQGLRESLVAVVRYFGGIKLGAGGLTRAYASSAAGCLAQAKIGNFEPCVEATLAVGYAAVDAALRFLEREEVLSRAFSDRAEFVVAIKEADAERFCGRARDFFNGKVQITFGKRYFYPFADGE